jgi:hypothetical protein
MSQNPGHCSECLAWRNRNLLIQLWCTKFSSLPFTKWNHPGNIIRIVIEVNMNSLAGTLLDSNSEKGTFEVKRWTSVKVPG